MGGEAVAADVDKQAAHRGVIRADVLDLGVEALRRQTVTANKNSGHRSIGRPDFIPGHAHAIVVHEAVVSDLRQPWFRGEIVQLRINSMLDAAHLRADPASPAAGDCGGACSINHDISILD